MHSFPSDESYDVSVPALPGCVTQGETYEEAVAMAQEAIKGYLEALAAVGAPLPVEPQPSGSLTVAMRVRTPEMA